MNWKKKLIFVLIFLNLLTGCNKKDRLNNTDETEQKDDYSFVSNDDIEQESNIAYEIVGEVSTEEAESTIPADEYVTEVYESIYQKRELTEEELKLLNSLFSVKYGINSALKNIESIVVEYPYSELYQSSDINEKYTTVTGEQIIVNNKIQFEKLYNKVLENNQVYMERYNVRNYQNTTEVFIKNVCIQIELQINDYLSKGLLDVSLMNEKLNDLKVFSYNDYANGFYASEKGILALNYNSLDDVGTINHEIVHLAQSATANEIETKNYLNRFGFCYQNSNDKINSGYWNWFFEASAESLSMDFNNNNNSTYYSSAISQLETIKFANFLTDTSLENTLFKSDKEKFYKILSANTPEEKIEVNNMFYALTILLSDSPGCEGANFYKELKKQYEIDMSGRENRIFNESLNGIVAISESKMFYSNLLNKVKNKQVTLYDVYTVISTFELELSRQLWYQTKYGSLEYFLEEYNTIQEEFLGVLSQNTNISVEDLKQLYYLFNANTKIEKINVKFLLDAENEFLSYINKSRVGNKKDAILKVYNDYYGYLFTENKKK